MMKSIYDPTLTNEERAEIGREIGRQIREEWNLETLPQSDLIPGTKGIIENDEIDANLVLTEPSPFADDIIKMIINSRGHD